MSPSKEIVRAVRELRGPASVHAHHCANTAARWVKATYLCVATVAAAHLRGLRGALYLHFDLWLQARRELLATISPDTCSPGLQVLRRSCGKSALPARVSREAAPTPGAPRSAHLRSRPAAAAAVGAVGAAARRRVDAAAPPHHAGPLLTSPLPPPSPPPPRTAACSSFSLHLHLLHLLSHHLHHPAARLPRAEEGRPLAAAARPPAGRKGRPPSLRTAPHSAPRDHPRAWGSPKHPRAPAQPLGSSPWPQQLASRHPEDADVPPSASRSTASTQPTPPPTRATARCPPRGRCLKPPPAPSEDRGVPSACLGQRKASGPRLGTAGSETPPSRHTLQEQPPHCRLPRPRGG